MDSKEEITNGANGMEEEEENDQEKENTNKKQVKKKKEPAPEKTNPNKKKEPATEKIIPNKKKEPVPEKITPNKVYYPMLAHPFATKKKEISFPCYAQPKLDGVRCVAVGDELISRNGCPFPTLEHIKKELKLNTDKLILDGELYTDDINFEKISGLVRKTKKTPEEEEDSLKIYFNVFDVIDTNLDFEERLARLNKFFNANKNMQHIKQVVTEDCKDEQQVMEYLDKYTNQGYEGVIVRNKKGKYAENARSNNLQKLKKFKDEEFEIIDFTSAKTGKEIGCVVWICKTKEGKKFNVRPLGSYEDRKKLYNNGKDYIGKMLTVKYQELTHDHVPRFPVGITTSHSASREPECANL